jgi:hypothetical protein
VSTTEIDRELIRETLLRFCRGVDTADMDLVRSSFWPGGTDDHVGFYSGPIEGIIPTMVSMRARLLVTTHILTNASIQISGDSADVESYSTAYHRYTYEGAEYHWTAGGRYTDRFEKRDGEWRTAQRRSVVEWSKVVPVAQTDPPAALITP